MYIILGIKRLTLGCSNYVKAEFTMNIDFRGFMTKAMVIIIVQMLIAVPVIQNMNNVMKICLDGDLANSQALFSNTSS